MRCEDCSHAEMCKWIDELGGRGCDFLSQEPCDDAISREAAITIAGTHTLTVDETVKALERLPTVAPKPIECGDVISRKDVINAIDKWISEYKPQHYLIQSIRELPPVTQKSETVTEFTDRCRECGAKYGKLLKQKSGKWIALVARPMTNEEREYYSEQLDYCDGDAVIYDCPLPEEGQDVLITTCTGVVLIDTFFNDYDGCGFEGYDIEDVKAWMPLPEPYEPQEGSDKE